MGEGPDWLARVGSMRQWSRGTARAPHKPLLLLYALGLLQQRGRNEPIGYVDAEAHLDGLLKEFGPPRATSPSYPFVRLTHDGLWLVRAESGRPLDDAGDSRTFLRRERARGQLDPAFASALLDDRDLLIRVARQVLESEFPVSLQRPLARSVGLDLDDADLPDTEPVRERRRRAASFRHDVLVAYEYRCAMCGYEGRIGGDVVGLEAAHVQWWSYGGPDRVANGLALCCMHHLLFDRGVLGLSEERTVDVSREFVGRDDASRRMVLALTAQAVASPQADVPPVAIEHIRWHRAQVLKVPCRVAGS